MNSENLNESIGNIADKYINEALDSEKKGKLQINRVSKFVTVIISFALLFIWMHQQVVDSDVDGKYKEIICVSGGNSNVVITDTNKAFALCQSDDKIRYLYSFRTPVFVNDENIYTVVDKKMVYVDVTENDVSIEEISFDDKIIPNEILYVTDKCIAFQGRVWGSDVLKKYLYSTVTMEVSRLTTEVGSKELDYCIPICGNILMQYGNDIKISMGAATLYRASLINLDNNVRVPLGEINPNGCYFAGAFYYPVEGNVVGRVELPKELFEDMTQTMTLEEIQALEERIVPAEAEMIEIPGIEGEQRVKKLYQVDEERIAVVTESVASQEGSELRNVLYIYRVREAETEKLFECAGSINDLANNGESVVFIYDENGAEESSYEILEIGR